jgi:proteasome accessory factor B
MDISRLHRVLKIITLLQTRHRYSPDDLAAELEVSKRTIFRDMNMLELAGIPFFFDRATGGYEIHKTYFLPPVNLSIEEALSLLALAEQSAADGAVPMLDGALDAARKIESQLPLAIRAAVGQLSRRVVIRRAPVARHDHLQASYELVRKAVAARRAITGRYISFHEKKQLRVEVEPYWLVFHERAWYCIGRSVDHGEVRTFKLGRFADLELSARTFAAPKGTLDQYLGNAWRFMREGREYSVRLRFAPLVAPNVAEVNWHRTQKIIWQDDGSIFFDVKVDGLNEIYWWILGYGDQVEVLQPEVLRTRVQSAAQKLVKLYDAKS